MSDPNPYKPPQCDEPAPLKTMVKRGIGAVTLALLTPVAVIITGAISCAVTIQFFDTAEGAMSLEDPILVALLMWLTPPCLTLIVMSVLIIRARSKERVP